MLNSCGSERQRLWLTLTQHAPFLLAVTESTRNLRLWVGMRGMKIVFKILVEKSENRAWVNVYTTRNVLTLGKALRRQDVHLEACRRPRWIVLATATCVTDSCDFTSWICAWNGEKSAAPSSSDVCGNFLRFLKECFRQCCRCRRKKCHYV